MASHMTKTALAIGFFALAVLVGLLSSGYMEGFMQKDAGMPLDGPAMGPYDTSLVDDVK